MPVFVLGAGFGGSGNNLMPGTNKTLALISLSNKTINTSVNQL